MKEPIAALRAEAHNSGMGHRPGWAMSSAKGNLKWVATSPLATWPLGFHVNKGEGEGNHSTHLNLRTVNDDMRRHRLDVVARPLTSWSPSIVVVRPLGWRWLTGRHRHSSI
jgi:hypothetical protein